RNPEYRARRLAVLWKSSALAKTPNHRCAISSVLLRLRSRNRKKRHKCRPSPSMRKNIHRAPAKPVQRHARGQEIKAELRELPPAILREQLIDRFPQTMKVENVGGGVIDLLPGKRFGAPIRALLLL